MTQNIVNGFPQFHDFTYLRSKFYGTAATQLAKVKTDINLLTDVIGDQIQVEEATLPLLHVVRDGAMLMQDEGYELVGPNIIRVYPGLLETESVEFRFFTGISGVLNYIPVAPPAPSGDGYDQTVSEALVYTDDSEPAVGAYSPIVINGKTQITTHFDIDKGRVDIFINGGRVGLHSGIWQLLDANTIELNDDYSSTKTKVEIVKHIVGL